MTVLTDRFGDCKEFEVISGHFSPRYRKGDRLTLVSDRATKAPYFSNHRTKLIQRVYPHRIAPYVPKIKQFDLLGVRSAIAWLKNKFS